MMWIAIGCLIAGVILLAAMWIWQARASKDPETMQRFMRWKSGLQIAYLVFFMAAAVCFLIW